MIKQRFQKILNIMVKLFNDEEKIQDNEQKKGLFGFFKNTEGEEEKPEGEVEEPELKKKS